MSRYRNDDLAYGDLPGQPQPQRWDRDRFSRESRGAPVIEQRPPYRQSAERPYYEDDRYYQDSHSRGPGGTRDRRFYEEDEYYDPRATSGAVIPFRPARPERPAAPPRPRPRMMRRQSSVDRIEFDRRTYYDDEYRPPPPPRPREAKSSRYDIRIYDDVKVQDQEQYGDDTGFREYREREWTRSRTRNDSPSPNRRAPTEIVTAPGFEEEIIETKTVSVEKPYPRRGKTRMPKRLVHTKVLFDLGYPFYEEDEKTILIEKALGPENIDEVFAKSREYRERETITTTTRLIEAPAPAPLPPQSFIEPPRSVKEWDNYDPPDRPISPGSSISQATRKSRRRAQSVHEDIHEVDRYSRHGGGASIHESIHRDVHRDISPASTQRTRKSRARSRARSRAASRSDDETIYEKRVFREDIEESAPMDLGALIPRSKSRTDVEIKDEIRELERERRELRKEGDIIRYDRSVVKRDVSPIDRLLIQPPPVGEIIIADRRDGDAIAVRKDKRGRSRPPSAALLKGMFYTIT